jgi:hypothetical protein
MLGVNLVVRVGSGGSDPNRVYFFRVIDRVHCSGVNDSGSGGDPANKSGQDLAGPVKFGAYSSDTT